MGKSEEQKASEAVEENKDATAAGNTTSAANISAGEVELPQGGSKKSKEEEFEENQKALAKKQGLPEGAVPEVRPQGFAARRSQDSGLTEKLREEDALASEAPAMGLKEYEAAQNNPSGEDKKKPGITRAAHVGTVVEVLSGPHEGRKGAVLRVVSYPSLQERTIKGMGGEDADYVNPKEVEVAFRGDERDGERTVLDLSEIEYRVHTDGAFAGRASVMGAI